MLETTTKLQRQVFALIEKKHPLGKKWLLEYMEWTGLKKSTAYNHCNGSTAMTADDVLRLMSRYQVHWNDLFPKAENGTISMQFSAATKKPSAPLEFMQGLQGHLRQLSQAKISRICFFSNDIPLFYFFEFPLLTAFKFYYWDYAVWGNTNPEKEPFDRKWIEKPEIQQALHIAKDLIRTYQTIPRTEFWSPNMFNIIVQVILKVERDQYITASSVSENIRKEVLSLQDYLFKMANTVDQRAYPLHEIRCNTSIYGNNTVLAITEQGNHVFSTLENPNIVYFNNEAMGNYTEAWFLNTRKHSEAMNVGSDQIRRTFFAKVKDDVADCLLSSMSN
jgi:hypothetical protein